MLAPNERPALGVFEDDYVSHHLDNAATLLRRAAMIQDSAVGNGVDYPSAER